MSTSVWLRTYFSLKYRLQTDSVHLFIEHTPHKRMKVNAVRLYVHIMHFVCVFAFISHSRTDMDAALCSIKPHRIQWKWRLSGSQKDQSVVIYPTFQIWPLMIFGCFQNWRNSWWNGCLIKVLSSTYSPDLAPCDIQLFPKLKEQLIKWMFSINEDILLAGDQVTYSWKMLSRLWLCYEDLENNMVFLNLVIDAMGWLWMLWYFNGHHQFSTDSICNYYCQGVVMNGYV